jgi:hypothetical protein
MRSDRFATTSNDALGITIKIYSGLPTTADGSPLYTDTDDTDDTDDNE